MAVITLQDNKYLYAPFIVPQSKTVTVDMEAERPVNVYVLRNVQDLEAYRTGQKTFVPVAIGQQFYFDKIYLPSVSEGVPQFPSQLLGTSLLGISATLPSAPSGASALLGLLGMSIVAGSTWYLVIANRPENGNIAVYYRVYNA